MPRQTNLLYSLVLKKALYGRSNTCIVEPEQKTDVAARHLKQRYLVHLATLERRTSLGVHTKNVTGQKIVHSLLSLSCRHDNHYPARKRHQR